MDWSFQLYSARNFQPWDTVLSMLADAGYRKVEGFGGVYEDPSGLRALMDRHGLSMPTGHFGLDVLENEFDRALSIAYTLGIETMICPYIAAELRPSDGPGWRAFAARLAAIEERCRAAGRGFAWHNHDFEFAPTPDGEVPQRVILDAVPEIGWEIDIAWVVRGGADPMAWIEEYGTRIVAAHLKDIAPQGEAVDEDSWSDVGYGTLDWPALLNALKEKTATGIYAVEHDNPSDAERFARRSLATVKGILE